MRKLVALLIGLLSTALCAQDYTKSSEYGFRLATNVAESTYGWTNDNTYPFRIYSLALNSGSIVTSTVSLVRPHSITRQLVGDVVTTNDMGSIETNYYYIVTNTVTTYTTNQLLCVTNTASIFDEDDMPKVYMQRGDILRFNFGASNAISILLDALR
jgi:hypothetical protein